MQYKKFPVLRGRFILNLVEFSYLLRFPGIFIFGHPICFSSRHPSFSFFNVLTKKICRYDSLYEILSSFQTQLIFQQTDQQARTAELVSNFDLFERFQHQFCIKNAVFMNLFVKIRTSLVTLFFLVVQAQASPSAANTAFVICHCSVFSAPEIKYTAKTMKLFFKYFISQKVNL